MRRRDRAWAVVYLVLLLATSGESLSELSHLWHSITNKTRASVQNIQWIAAWKQKDIIIASPMMASIFVEVINATTDVELNSLSFSKWGDSSNGLPHWRKEFFTWSQRKAKAFRRDAYFAVAYRNLVDNGIASPMLWDNLHDSHVGDDIQGTRIPHILHCELHVPQMKPSFSVTNERLQKPWGMTVNYERRVLYLDGPFVLKSFPDIYYEKTQSNSRAYACNNQAKFLDWACSSPTPAKGLLALILGFTGLCIGFILLFAILCLGGTKRLIFGSLVIIVSSLMVFHSDLYYLLR